MTNSQRLAIVRACLRRWLREHHDNASDGDLILRESILIRDDFYCGRRFQAENHHAIWFIEEDELKVYSGDREVVAVFTGDEIDAESEEVRILKLPKVDEHTEIRRAA